MWFECKMMKLTSLINAASVVAKEASLAAKEANLTAKEIELNTWEAELNTREAELKEKLALVERAIMEREHFRRLKEKVEIQYRQQREFLIASSENEKRMFEREKKCEVLAALLEKERSEVRVKAIFYKDNEERLASERAAAKEEREKYIHERKRIAAFIEKEQAMKRQRVGD